jgi:DNA-binding transcriptional MerR regulator
VRIGEVAAASGVTPKAIRYYESIGLLPPPDRTPAGYRDYDAGDVDRVGFIRDAREVGLGLEQISQILSMSDRHESPCAYVRDAVAAVAADLDQRIAELQRTRRVVDAMLAGDDEHDRPARFCRLIERRPHVV